MEQQTLLQLVNMFNIIVPFLFHSFLVVYKSACLIAIFPFPVPPLHLELSHLDGKLCVTIKASLLLNVQESCAMTP